VPISAIVMKADTAATNRYEVKDEKPDDKKVVAKTDKKFECVFVKEGNKAKIRIVKTGIQDNTNIEVISGIKKGDVIIIGPYTTVSKDLNSGDKVVIADSKSKEKEPKK
jgi:HlyD family secretion protein